MSTRTFVLNVTAQPTSALATVATNLLPGEVVQFTAPSLAQYDSSNNSKPWESPWIDPDGDGIFEGRTGMVDWCSNMAFSQATGTSGRFMAAGGRPAASGTYAGNWVKIIYYDLAQDKWDSVQNPFGGTTGAGRLYQSFCNAESIRRFFYRRYEEGSWPTQVWNTQGWIKDTAIPEVPSGIGPIGLARAFVWMPTFSLNGVPMTQGALLTMGSHNGTWRCAAFDWANRGLGAAAWKQVITPIGGVGFTTGNLYGHMAGVYVPAANAAVMGAPIGRGLMVIKSDGTYFESTGQPCPISAGNGRGILTAHPSKASAIFFPAAGAASNIHELVIGTNSASWEDRGPNKPQLAYTQQIGGTMPDLGVVVSVASASDTQGRLMYVYKPNF